MKVLVLRLAIEDPVVAGRPDSDANTITSYPNIPGGVMRGGILAKWLKENRSFSESFVNGDCLFLSANPALVGGGVWGRSIPTPLSWHVAKHEVGSSPAVIHLLSGATSGDSAVATRPIGGFCLPDPDSAEIISVLERITIHTERHVKLGRAVDPKNAGDERPGAVFRSIAIDSGQAFVAMVLSDQEALLRSLAGVLAPMVILRLGWSKNHGGAARIVESQIEDFIECGEFPDEDATECTLTLTSPGLFRDAWGHWAGEPDLKTLAAALGVSELRVVKRVVKREVAGGFNRKWNLPLPQDHAVAAGSEFALAWERKVKAGAWRSVVEQGLGERRTEGFGCVAINLPVPRAIRRRTALLPDEIAASGGSLGTEERKLIQVVVNQIFRAKLDNLIRMTPVSLVGGAGAPTPALVARLREMLPVAATPAAVRQRLARSVQERLRARVRAGGVDTTLSELLTTNESLRTSVDSIRRDSELEGIAPSMGVDKATRELLDHVLAGLARAAKARKAGA